MKTVISYCLFEPIHMHPHRTWDVHKENSSRYWFNIPSLIIANKILYPDAEIRFYVDENTTKNPLFKLLHKKLVSVHVIDMDYKNTSEPMLWRMMPFWDDVDCFFTRDVDSLPNMSEYRCSKFFENSEYSIQTIRSHENHYHEQGCDMLGGLSGFKPKMIQNAPESFDEYYNGRNNMPWAQDQYLMVTTFLYSQKEDFLRDNFLDCPIDDQTRKASVPSTQITEEQIRSVSLNTEQINVLLLTNKMCSWAGEPCDARGEVLWNMLNMDNKYSARLKKMIMEDDFLRDFYNVEVANIQK